MKTKYTVLAAAVTALLSTGAGAVDWGGYTRVGPGQKTASGDDKRCFNGGDGGGFGSQAPGHGGIGRLGNECETYGEFGLSQNFQAGGVNYKALVMTNFYTTGSSGSGVAMKPEINQLYIEGKGYDIAPDMTFWIGRRFYHRADVHFDDSFYVMGGLQGSSGAGVDNIAVGGGSLGVALFRNNDAGTGDNAGTLLNVDLQGLNVNPGGKLRLIGSFTSFSGTGGESGAGLTLQHNQANVLGGDNTLWLQWSQGSTWLDMGFAGANQNSDYKRWRIADSIAWTNGPLTGQTLFHYGHVEEPTAGGGSVSSKTVSLAGRVAYATSKNFKIQGELGIAQSKPEGGDSQRVMKATIAPTLTVGQNYYDRPELRFYVSYFNFNEAYRDANGLTKKSKTAAGFQAEIWF